jgi:hypothetical protein
VSYPYSFIATFLVGVYWQSILAQYDSQQLGTSVSLYKYRIAFVVLCVILIVEEHTTATLRGERIQNAWYLVLVTAIFILGSVVGIGSFYSYTGWKVIKCLQNTNNNSVGKKETVRRVRYKINNNNSQFL